MTYEVGEQVMIDEHSLGTAHGLIGELVTIIAHNSAGYMCSHPSVDYNFPVFDSEIVHQLTSKDIAYITKLFTEINAL